MDRLRRSLRKESGGNRTRSQTPSRPDDSEYQEESIIPDLDQQNEQNDESASNTARSTTSNYDANSEFEASEADPADSRPTSPADEDVNPLTHPKVIATKADPLGYFVLSNYIDMHNLANKEASNKDIVKFCTRFIKNQKLQHKTWKKNTEMETRKVVKEENAKSTKRHFTAFNTHSGIKAPPHFSTIATLEKDQRIKVANSTFPAKGTFCGKKPPYVTEFLNDMNQAQAVMKVSRSEFKMYLQRSTSGEAYTLVAQSFQMGLSIESVYHSLLLTYDNQISTQEAAAKLLNFKAAKTMGFPRVVGTIRNLASRAAVHYTSPEERANVFNITATDALKRSLPTYSKNLVSETQVQLSHELGHAPTYHELTASLYRHNDAMDQDIQTNGVAHNYNGDLSLYKKAGSHDKEKEKEKNKDHKSEHKNKNGYQNSKIDVTKHYQKSGSIKEISTKPDHQKSGKQHRNSYGNNYGNNNGNSNGKQDYHIPYGNSAKRYCGACGQNTHQSSDGCKLLRDDEGRQVHQALTSGYCSVCFKRYEKKLYHAEVYCPGRPAMMKLYQKKEVYPSGLFKKTFHEWAAQQPGAPKI